MQVNYNFELLNKIIYCTGSADILNNMINTPPRELFDSEVIDFLNDVSKELMKDSRAKAFSDVITFGFWIRKASVLKLKERFTQQDNALHYGKGIAFHIAPSNVPCNFAYSLVSGLLTGNANIVRIPSKDFPQVEVLIDAFNTVLEYHNSMKPYIVLVKYERNKDVNDLFSSICDIRIVWGGNQTISKLRESKIPPRSGEITFSDRYSLAIIDSDSYLKENDKTKIAEDFYNDTFFSDQNACTSPRIIVWIGDNKERAKRLFWHEEHEIVSKKYNYQEIQGVNKLTRVFLASVAIHGLKVVEHEDNLIVRVSVSNINEELLEHCEHSGFFYEYDCDDIHELKSICNNKSCQTIAYIGDKNEVLPLVKAGIKGIDRVVPMGKTMDFDLIWDGYNLPAMMTRMIVME